MTIELRLPNCRRGWARRSIGWTSIDDGVLTRAELLTIRASTGNVYDGRRHRH